MKIADIDNSLLDLFRRGCVIPASPLALDNNRTFDERYQRALIRYYIDSGAGGIAAGVHSTQFEIRQHGIFETVLSVISEEIDSWSKKQHKNIFKIAGICGRTEQALNEAAFAVTAGYHAGLVSLAMMKNESWEEMIIHCRKISRIIPVIGFYMQTAVGGVSLPYEFWKEFASISNVLGIKIAPFNRYKTLDVIRAVCDAGKEEEITLYSGNDDNIITDLLTEYKIKSGGGHKKIRIRGGLLGHWCVWTRKAVELLNEIHNLANEEKDIPVELLTRAIQVTDSNAAFFDAANDFAGCIPGLHEVLRRQGLMENVWCLNPDEKLSAGQTEEIKRVYEAYPHLNDDEFVRKNLEKWLK